MSDKDAQRRKKVPLAHAFNSRAGGVDAWRVINLQATKAKGGAPNTHVSFVKSVTETGEMECGGVCVSDSVELVRQQLDKEREGFKRRPFFFANGLRP